MIPFYTIAPFMDKGLQNKHYPSFSPWSYLLVKCSWDSYTIKTTIQLLQC